jgi:hypothetical protein
LGSGPNWLYLLYNQSLKLNKRSIIENIEKQIVGIIENNSPELTAEDLLAENSKINYQDI